MSECQNLQQQLDEYLSDRISDFEKRRIDSHLRHCSDCAAEVKDYREAIDELRSAAREVQIEPSLSLQYSLNRLAPADPRPETANQHYYSLIVAGIVMFLISTLLGVLDHFGTITIST